MSVRRSSSSFFVSIVEVGVAGAGASKRPAVVGVSGSATSSSRVVELREDYSAWGDLK
jgi:hypothetical protein